MNISQPAPGTPEGPAPEVTLIQEDFSTETGVLVHRQLFSDGSRRNVVGGVVEDVPVLSDLEKVAEAVVTNVEDLAAAALAEAEAIAEKLAEATEEERAAVEEELARVEELAEEVKAKIESEVWVPSAEELDAAKSAFEKAVDAVEEKVEEIVDAVEEKVEEVVDEIEDLTFKTVPQLKELAEKLGIDLGKSTKKDEILDKIKDAQ